VPDAHADLDVRAVEPADRAAVHELLQASLGWVPDEQYGRFFEWKHVENPFGASPSWVALDGPRIVGFRTFMRWEWVDGAGDVHRAVRAVDTATHPEYQGRGIFKLLTMHALDAFEREGIEFVFNTPNDQSRPGYLKMGWQLVARLPVLARPGSLTSLVRLVRARVPADKWSEPTSAGLDARAVLADRPAVEALLAAVEPWPGLSTRRSAQFLAWRYGFADLAYRAIVAGEGPEDGMILFRVRRRGAAREAVIADALMPSQRLVAPLVRRVLRESGADYAVRLGVDRSVRAGFLPVPGQGPTLVWRAVTSSTVPPLAQWKLTMGDIELF
jgi:GNAT superfamily N-acetyltransferase